MSSLLELAVGRWLVDYWSQPPDFSASDLRKMLVEATSSIARKELILTRASQVGQGGGGGGVLFVGDLLLWSSSWNGDDGGKRAAAAAPPPEVSSPTVVAALTGWLEGRASEVWRT